MKSMIHSWKKKAAQYRELKKQKGVTLLEIIIVLGIIGIIAAGVVILAQRAFTAQDISDVIENTNSVRVSMAEAYKDESTYPSSTFDVTSLTKATIATSSADAPIVTLVKLGKLDAAEAFNGISSDAFEIGAATLASDGPQGAAGAAKGFYVVVNGLDVEDCRNLASQVGAQWDYVASATAGAGTRANLGIVAMDADAASGSAVLKSLKADALTPASIVSAGFCDAGDSTNALVLGSR